MGFGGKLLWRAFGIPTGILGRLGGRIMSGARQSNIAMRVVELLDVRQDDCVLEIGFGPGVGMQRIQERLGVGGLLVGIDPSEVMMQMASIRNAEAIKKGTAKLLKGTAEQIPFPEESFTKVYAMNSMQLWPDELAGLREVQRILKPGGRIVLSFTGPARKAITCKAVRAVLEEASFKEIDTTDIDSTIYVVAMKQRSGST